MKANPQSTQILENNSGIAKESSSKNAGLVRILRIIMPLIAVICIVVFPPWNAIFTWMTPLPDSVQEQVDSSVEKGLDGVIVYVDQGAKGSALYAAGWKDREAQIPADPKTLFKIASISKLYIAAATAKIVHQEALSLDDTLQDLLPEISSRIDNADQITLKMLVQHRSGIPNFTDHEDFDWFSPTTEIDPSLELIFDEPADFEPDESYSYSNTNYLLIAKILDKVLGYSHHQFIATDIVRVLDLNETYGLLGDVNIENVVSAYYVDSDDNLRGLDFKIPGGSMIATARDVGVFLRALNDGSLLNEEEQAIYSSIYEYEHTGLLPGYFSIARYHEDIDTVVIFFVNSSDQDALAQAHIVYGRIVQIVRGQE